MQSNLVASVHFVLMHECVFEKGHYGDLSHVITEDVPGDSGGLTKYGIDQSSHPHVDIAALDLDGAIGIYQSEEWAKCRCDDLPKGLDTAVFDTAVDNGMGTAVRLLQAASGVTVDGFIGPKTIAAAAANPAFILHPFLIHRQQRYYAIVNSNPGDEKFLQGWLNRINDLCAYVGIPALPTHA